MNIINDPALNKIEIDESDHLSNCIKYFGVNHLDLDSDLDFCDEKKGNIVFCSKFKMKGKKNKLFNKLGSGLHVLKYKETAIYILIKELGTPVGLNDDTKIHIINYIYIDKSKLDILTDFVDSASEYYVKFILDKNKEVDKTTIYIWDDYWETI